jgi:hypothetical protein
LKRVVAIHNFVLEVVVLEVAMNDWLGIYAYSFLKVLFIGKVSESSI